MEKYRILFVSALSAELKIVKQEIKKLNISNNLEISFFESWIWNYKTIMNLSLYLAEQKYNFIVNIWVCWWNFDNKTGQPQGIAPTELCRGAPCGYPDKVIQISAIKNISNNKELISPIFFEFSKIKSIFCSEKIISCPTSLPLGQGELSWKDKRECPGVETEWGLVFVDMESYWFEMIWNKFQYPRIILKVPIDKIWEETKNFDFEKAKKCLRENINYSELLEKIDKYLDKNNNKDFSEEENILKNKIINNFNFSFSENIIIDKLLNKFIVLELWNLEEFFEENRELNKKEFLNKLKNIN